MKSACARRRSLQRASGCNQCHAVVAPSGRGERCSCEEKHETRSKPTARDRFQALTGGTDIFNSTCDTSESALLERL